jgi:hypothetical protein
VRRYLELTDSELMADASGWPQSSLRNGDRGFAAGKNHKDVADTQDRSFVILIVSLSDFSRAFIWIVNDMFSS